MYSCSQASGFAIAQSQPKVAALPLAVDTPLAFVRLCAFFATASFRIHVFAAFSPRDVLAVYPHVSDASSQVYLLRLRVLSAAFSVLQSDHQAA